MRRGHLRTPRRGNDGPIRAGGVQFRAQALEHGAIGANRVVVAGGGRDGDDELNARTAHARGHPVEKVFVHRTGRAKICDEEDAALERASALVTHEHV